jgi:nucleotide-binding universal stress UspA family protein
LWQTSGKERNLFIAKLLGSIGQQQVIETTILFAKTPDSSTEARHAFKSVSQAMRAQNAAVMERTVSSDNVLDVIAEEANKGYDLIVMSEDDPSADAHYVFGPLVDSVILETSTRCLVVYVPEKATERAIKQVIVPVRDSELSLNAGEFGITLAKSLGAEVTCLSIDTPESVQLYSAETRSGVTIERNITDEIAGSLAELSKALDVPFQSKILDASLHPAAAIILAAQQSNADLIVLGAEPKLAKGLFLGHTINYVLRHAPCAVIVLKL